MRLIPKLNVKLCSLDVTLYKQGKETKIALIRKTVLGRTLMSRYASGNSQIIPSSLTFFLD